MMDNIQDRIKRSAPSGAECGQGMMNAAAYKPPTVMERLRAQRSDLVRRLTDVNEAIEAFESSPEMAAVLEKLSKINY